MLILCSLSRTFKCLNINYSLIVIADRHFTLHIKKYDDEESIKYFQIVYDCLFCNRYRLDLFNGLKFLIEKIPNNKMKKIIITLTDGITEQLLFIDDWKKSLFNKENISFGFIFIMPPIKGDDNKKIKILWNNFEKGSSKSISNVKVIQIEDEIKLELINEFFKTFIIQKKDENNEEIKKNELKNLKFTSIENLKKLLNNLKKNKFEKKSIYFNNIVLKFPKMRNKVNIKNKEIKKVKTIIEKEEKITSEIKNLANTFLLDNNSIKYYLIEMLFPLNQGTKKELSSTGTEFDFPSLIINWYNPVPNPKIFLEEKGDLEKKYSVTLIIDPSKYCLNEISKIHTIYTIKVILSYLCIADLPYFDLIIATNNESIILCIGENSKNELQNNKSIIWEYLFYYLENPETNIKLSDGINKAYILNQKRYNSTNYIFVLTDGLYDKIEKDNILYEVENCINSNIKIIGIGIGIYPINIQKLFPFIVYSPNPEEVIYSIISFFGDNSLKLENKMPKWNNYLLLI